MLVAISIFSCQHCYLVFNFRRVSKAPLLSRCNSEVKYDSDRHYRDQVYCAPFPTATSFSETVVAVRNCTWRSYKSQVYLEPRQKPISYRSTTIIYPKHAKNTYRTTLNYNATGSRRWFVSTVQLESSEDTSPCIIYTEDL